MKKLPKILAIIGARPQFIKHAPLLGNSEWQGKLDIISLHTGQHYDENMSGVFFDQLNIPKPEYQLTIGSGPHGEQTGKMMMEIEKVCQLENVDGIIVYGDTNSTLAGALVGSKMHIPVFHIEAGLRSFDKKMPEEINRILTDHVSDILFIPTDNARKNLEKEGIGNDKIYAVGDLMLDAHKFFLKYSSNVQSKVEENRKFVLVTIHRAENTNSFDRMKGITKFLTDISKNLDVVIPIHPRTQKYLKEYKLFDTWVDEFDLISPIGYIEMLDYEAKATVIVTDSGGVQKEAFFSRTPCITVRDSTEWTELIDCGANRLFDPTNYKTIDLQEIVDTEVDYDLNLFGTESAAKVILTKIIEYYK
jgi:UDP-GlcNAc3NAcA epimerase